MKLPYSLLIFALAGVSVFIYATNHDSSKFNVSITVKETCNVTTGNGAELDFGSVNRASTDATGSNDLKVNCTQGTPYRIALQSPRIMSNTAGNNLTIPYALYQDANKTVLFGSDLQNAYSSIGTGNSQTIPVWGRVKQADTNVPAGQYSDKVTVVVTY